MTETFRDVAPRLAANGYLPVPVKARDKAPIPKDWTNYRLAPGDTEQYPFASTGIICGPVVAADIDVLHDELAARLEALALQRLGVAPRRIGNAPKVLLLYRTVAPFAKLQTRGYRLPDDAPDAKAHKVEILATGQQFVAYGIHPTTERPYTWNGAGDPLDIPAAELPVLDEAMARDFIREADELLAEYGEPCGRLRDEDARRSHEPNEQQRGEPNVIRSALRAIPNDDLSRDDWIYIGLALKGALGEGGRGVWLEWSRSSRKSGTSGAADTPEKAWASFKPTKIGAGTIVHFARMHGWEPATTGQDAPDWTADVPPPEGAGAAPREAQDKATASNEAFSFDITDVVGMYRTPEPVYGLAVQRGRVQALTSPTNHGKTAVVTTVIPAVALGLYIGVEDVTKGKVLVLCGENPEDFYGRLMATMHELNIPMGLLKGRVRIIPHSFPLITRMEEIREVAKQMGEVVLVVVDTNASYYGYADEIDNVMQRAQAADLRELTRLPGTPAVLATCHPVKNATHDNLMPRGGGAFLNEIDTNLTVWKENDVATFHFQHKIRGPSFEPIKFNLKLCPVPGQLDAKGRQPHTVVAVPLNDAQVEIIEFKAIQDENLLLAEMLKNKRGSIAEWAENLGWVTPTRKPLKSKVHRLLKQLGQEKLVLKERRKYVVTDAGKKALNDEA